MENSLNKDSEISQEQLENFIKSLYPETFDRSDDTISAIHTWDLLNSIPIEEVPNEGFIVSTVNAILDKKYLDTMYIFIELAVKYLRKEEKAIEYIKSAAKIIKGDESALLLRIFGIPIEPKILHRVLINNNNTQIVGTVCSDNSIHTTIINEFNRDLFDKEILEELEKNSCEFKDVEEEDE